MNTRRSVTVGLWCVATLLVWTTGSLIVTAKVATGSITGVVRATTSVAAGTRSITLSGARITLANRDLPTQVMQAVTDDAGTFAFTGLPAATYLLTAEANGLPTITREIHLTDGASLTVEIEMTATVSESVTVRDEEGLLSAGETTTSNVVRDETLENMPLRSENYQSALSLTPGVIRGPNGENYLKGSRPGQSSYTVNGVDVTDPVTGTLAFDIPIEAASAVEVEENPYSTEFGRLVGGASNLETKGGSNNFKFTAARFFPLFRNVLKGPIESFRPRVTLGGPVVHDKFFFLQSFEYRFARLRVPSLSPQHDDSTSESFTSLTQFDLNINNRNRAKFVTAYFPQKANNIGLNTFNPQETTPNIKQHGTLFSLSEQAIFGDASFLSSALSYRTYDLNVFPKGGQQLTLAPDGNTGNYFADTRRQTHRVQWQETYYAHSFTLGGKHTLKVGSELDHTNLSAQFRYNSIFIRRSDGTLAQRIDFTDPSSIVLRVNEFAAFLQDRWTLGPTLVIDAGVRLDRDGIARENNLAPRVSFMFQPFKNGRTIVRGGVGIFYDRLPLSVGYFDAIDKLLDDEANENQPTGLVRSTRFAELPERVVTRFGPDGISPVDGPRLFSNEVERPLRDVRSVRFSLQLDQQLTKDLTARIGYLQRATTNDPIVEPRFSGLDSGVLVLSSSGSSRYRELQLLAMYNHPRFGNWNASYVWSSARGDLNTADNYLGDFPLPVIRPNAYGPLPFDVPHRLLIYGVMSMPHEINFSPTLEIRSGFPYSIVDQQLDFVGPRNQARFPTFVSLDAQVTKAFRIPKFEKHKVRIGAAVFNITNHFNPRDVQNNLGSPHFGQFYNSLGISVRGKLELVF